MVPIYSLMAQTVSTCYLLNWHFSRAGEFNPRLGLTRSLKIGDPPLILVLTSGREDKHTLNFQTDSLAELTSSNPA